METSGSGAVGGRMGTMDDPKWVKEADEEIREREGETGWEIGMIVEGFAREIRLSCSMRATSIEAAARMSL